MSFKVFVDGQEGTTGLRLLDYLTGRSDIELLRIDESKRKDPAERARFLNAADVAFLCLPDAASREAVSLVTNPNTCIIDASTAFRTDSGRSWRPVSAKPCAPASASPTPVATPPPSSCWPGRWWMPVCWPRTPRCRPFP